MAKSKGQVGKALMKDRRRGRKGGGGEEWVIAMNNYEIKSKVFALASH